MKVNSLVRLAAFQNVADALTALESDVRAVQAASAARRAAQQNVDLVRRQVEQGQVNVSILIEAQRAYLDTSLALVDAQASRFADTVALFQALGGGWWNRANLEEGTDGVRSSELAEKPVVQVN